MNQSVYWNVNKLLNVPHITPYMAYNVYSSINCERVACQKQILLRSQVGLRSMVSTSHMHPITPGPEVKDP